MRKRKIKNQFDSIFIPGYGEIPIGPESVPSTGKTASMEEISKAFHEIAKEGGLTLPSEQDISLPT